MGLFSRGGEFERDSVMVTAIRETALTAASLSRLAMIGALATTFALTGCGRKGPLDPPPGFAERRTEEQVELQRQAQQEQQQPQQQQWSLFDQPDPDAPPPPRAPRKRFFLDGLLN